MGRRKKEPPSVHRENIAHAAQLLFMEKGLEAASMDDIAKAAGYSKATLYVYFENKEAIISFLVLKSMEKLYQYISAALMQPVCIREKYNSICWGLVEYQEEFPFYFQFALRKINIDFEKNTSLSDEETFHIGEKINEIIKQFLTDGIEQGVLRSSLQILPTIFTFWGMISGLILMAANKENYVEKGMKLSRKEFIEYGIDTLYHSIAKH